jgi:amidase
MQKVKHLANITCVMAITRECSDRRGGGHSADFVLRRNGRRHKEAPRRECGSCEALRLCTTTNRRGIPDGPFAGVPFLLKDLEFLEGTRTTSGASVYQDTVAGHTGTLAQRFLDAGVTIFGKNSTPEFGLMPTTEPRLFGPTRNPWNLAHSSGGFSGGAGAAVAARIVPMAHASDGGRSIRIPASASGMFGLKPTRARDPLGPVRGEAWSGFSCGHVLSISVRDSAVMLDAVHGSEPSSPYVAPPLERPFAEEVGRDPGRLRIAFTDKSPYGDAIDPEIAAAVRDVATLLAGLGHHVDERAPVLAADPAVVMRPSSAPIRGSRCGLPNSSLAGP